VLVTNVAAWDDIESMADSLLEVFYKLFERSTVRLGIVEIKVGNKGKISWHCAVVNS
jgi:hypothetical protein